MCAPFGGAAPRTGAFEAGHRGSLGGGPMRHASRWVVLAVVLAPTARADVLSDWTDTGLKAAIAAKQPPFVQTRTMAMVHVAMFNAVNGIERRYASYGTLASDKAD